MLRIIAQSQFDVNEESIESAALVDSRKHETGRSFFLQDELPLPWFLQGNFQGLRAEEHQEGGLTGEPLW